MALPISRAGFHVIHHKHGTARSRRASRVRLAGEAMRAVDETKIAYWAAKRESIIPTETRRNVDMVNGGNGSFEPVTDIRQVANYGEARTAKLKRKPRPDEAQFSTVVAWAPASLLKEIPNVYPVTDATTGEQLTDKDGQPVFRSRFVAADDEAMNNYFQHVVNYFADLLPGGMDAIHGFAINYDEHRPHIHIMFDTFEPDDKQPEKLRTAHSKVWGQHRDVRWPEGHKKAGKTIMGRDKLSAMQANFKQMHHDLGIPIEFEPAPRAGRGDVLADFAAIEEERLLLKHAWEYAEREHESLTEATDRLKQRVNNETTRYNKLRDESSAYREQIEQYSEQLKQQQQQTAHTRSELTAASERLNVVRKDLQTATAELEATKAENNEAKQRRQSLDEASDALHRQAKRKMAEADEHIAEAVNERVEQLKPELTEQLQQAALAAIADDIEKEKEELKELKERAREARAQFDRYTDQSIKASNSARDAQQRFDIIKAATPEELTQALSSLNKQDVAIDYLKFLGGSIEGLEAFAQGQAWNTYVSDRIAAEEAKKQRQSGGGDNPQPDGGGDDDPQPGQ